jgi:hypothetical protein
MSLLLERQEHPLTCCYNYSHFDKKVLLSVQVWQEEAFVEVKDRESVLQLLPGLVLHLYTQAHFHSMPHMDQSMEVAVDKHHHNNGLSDHCD